MIDIKAQKPAKRYAKALFEAASNYDALQSEINIITNEIEKNSELKKFLFHPVIQKQDKKDVLKEICKNFEPETLDFLSILIDENRLYCLGEIKNFLFSMINSKNNVTTVEVTLAIDAGDDLKEIIKTRLQNKLQTSVIINFKKDESIIGGMLIKKGDTLIDLTIKSKVENFKRM